MKIRSRLLLFLLPPIIGFFLLMAFIFSYKWYQEIVEGYRIRLRSVVISASALIHSKKIFPVDSENPHSLKDIASSKAFQEIQKTLDVTRFYLIEAEDSSLSHSSSDFQSYELPEKPSFLSLLPMKIDMLALSTKDTLISPIYKNKKGQKFMSGYAPIRDEKGKILALLGADIHLTDLGKKLHQGFLIIAISVGLFLTLTLGFLFLVANKISHSLQKLTNSALSIAGGNYGDKIQVKGPKEISDLSLTLNTMSECLKENINRLKENSIISQRMHGEYECAMLLQNHMLQNVIDECQSDLIDIKIISFFSKNPRGMLLDIPKNEHQAIPLSFYVVEARKKGFNEMYQLLTKFKSFKDKPHKNLDKQFPHIHLQLDHKSGTMDFESNQFLSPFVWSTKKNTLFSPQTSSHPIEAGDYFFLSSSGLVHLIEGQKQIEVMLIKVLKHFAEDGLEICTTMLQKEISLILKRKDLVNDLHLLCFQLLY